MSELELIEQAVNIVRYFYNIETITDLTSVVKKMDGSIISGTSINGRPDSRIKKTEDHKFAIELLSCEDEPVTKNNVRIAQQLGHLFLHMGFQTDTECWDTQKCNTYFKCQNSHQAHQAFSFALALLMPDELYKNKANEYSENGFVDVKKLAEYFNVSIDAAGSRGCQLGYLKW